MNDRDVVKILREARQSMCRLIDILEQKQSHGSETNVCLVADVCLVAEISNAITYLEGAERNSPHATCEQCGTELTASTYAYCGDCHDER